MLISVFYHAGIAQRLVRLPSKQRMTVRFCLPAQNNKFKMIAIGLNPIVVTKKKRDVAQLVEFMVWDHDVAGPSPVIPTKVKKLYNF